MKRNIKRSWALLAALMLLLGACSGEAAPVPTVPVSTRPAVRSPSAVPPTIAQPTAAPQPTVAVAQSGGPAPEQPFGIDVWTPGDKQGTGTAFTYDQPAGEANPSRVWFALTDGAITEGLYPDVSLANVKALGLLVSDGKNFLADEMLDADQKIERLDGRTPAFRVTSTDRAGRWATVKEVVTDPQADTILFTVSFQALQGQPEDYRLYLNYIPRIGNSGAEDESAISAGGAEAWDTKAGVYTALLSNPPPALLTTGYTRKSDLTTDLKDYKVDRTYTSTELPGRLSIGMELPTSGVSTVALGFGNSREDARAAAEASLERGFPAVAQGYMQGWAGYLDGLVHPYLSLPLYDESLAVLKTHEDKTNYGAFVASISMPWGHKQTDVKTDNRGYRFVWPRDLYHTAMALYIAGDQQAARNTLAYLDDIMQRADGSFPQNSFLDGTPHWTALQMDEVADPIILAWHLKAADRYQSLVKPAADFIAEHGPRTMQERWEENGGYSPATLAAEIAALVCAADLAAQAGDNAGAERYLALADEWNANVEKWTLTTNGPLGGGTYYLRITDGDPNSPTTITIANGGGSYDQREIVDQSFLELVRLGLRKPDDPNILATLAVIDATIKVKTPKGDVYHRYPHDGYGESKPGEGPDGNGQPWPLLLAERSIYDVAFSRSEHPASWYLPVMASFANQGGMLPEQIFPDGNGSGSATPLVWAHGEFIMLANAVHQATVPDVPAVVAERYTQP